MSDAPPPMDDRLRSAFDALEDADLTEPPAPPPQVWEAIVAAVDDEVAVDVPAPGPRPATAPGPRPATAPGQEPASGPGQGPASGPGPAGVAEPLPLAGTTPSPRRAVPAETARGHHRVSKLRVAMLAAAAIVVVLLTGTVVVRMRQPSVTEVAVLNDDGLPNRSNVRGRAELVDDAGRQVLDVEVPDLPAAAKGQAFEVWLLAADGGLQSLGLIEHTGRFTVPAGIDVTKFNIVDVSREPVDGNPTHSGDSVVRGTLVPR